MPAATVAQLRLIHAAVEYLTELDGQNRTYVIDMSQDMLAAVIGGRPLAPLAGYIKHYCDVLDSPEEDAARIAAEIESTLGGDTS